MLEEYKELCRTAASVIPGWESTSKNDLCRGYVSNKGNSRLQDAYMSAILYKYWPLISKYYHQSANCATPEECYTWLVDSVLCCVNLASWENPDSSIYKDPNGPDKVINRCMKCARLTYYQFINRKKRKDDFGMLSMEELKENLGDSFLDIPDDEQEVNLSELMIKEYVVQEFQRKNYFLAFLIHYIIFEDVFDVHASYEQRSQAELNIRKLCKSLNTLDDAELLSFSQEYDLPFPDVKKASEYVLMIPQSSMRRKVLLTIENLKHSKFIKALSEVKYAN